MTSLNRILGRSHPKKLALSMRGGFMRAIGYVGVLQALDENEIRIDYFCASSMGALVAACYCYGLGPEAMVELAHHKLRLQPMINVTTLSHAVLLDQHMILKELRDVFGETRIEELPIKLLVQVTNLETQDEELFESGELAMILAASTAFPFLTLPVEINGRHYIDGDFSATYGADKLRARGADVVVGLSPGKRKLNLNSINLNNRIREMLFIPFSKIRAQDMALHPLDMLITDLAFDFEPMDFSHTEELIKHAYSRTMQVMPEIKKLVGKN